MVTKPSTWPNVIPRGPGPKVAVRRKVDGTAGEAEGAVVSKGSSFALLDGEAIAAASPPKNDERFLTFSAADGSAADGSDAEGTAAPCSRTTVSFAACSAAPLLAASASVAKAAPRSTSSTGGISSSNTMGFSAARCISSLMRDITEARSIPSTTIPATLMTLLPTTTPWCSACEPGVTFRMVTKPSTWPNAIPRGPGPKVTVNRKVKEDTWASCEMLRCLAEGTA